MRNHPALCQLSLRSEESPSFSLRMRSSRCLLGHQGNLRTHYNTYLPPANERRPAKGRLVSFSVALNTMLGIKTFSNYFKDLNSYESLDSNFLIFGSADQKHLKNSQDDANQVLRGTKTFAPVVAIKVPKQHKTRQSRPNSPS